MSANKLSKTYSRPGGDGGGRPLLRTGEAPGGCCAVLLRGHPDSILELPLPRWQRQGGPQGTPAAPNSLD